jgi:Toprim domain
MWNGKCVDSGSCPAHLARWASAALSDECNNIRNASPKQANDTLNHAAGALGQLIGAGALDRSQVEHALLGAALERKIPAQEAHATIASGLAWGTANPRDLSRVGAGLPDNRPVVRSPSSERTAGQDRNRERAQAIWDASRAISGTPAEAYLRSRGIPGNPPGALRFAKGVAMPDGSRHAALIAAVTTVAGELVAIQRTAVLPDGSGKADIPHAKASLGSTKDAAVVLGDLAISDTVVEGEGVETVLSATQVTALPGIATLSAGTLGKPKLPPNVRRIIILGEYGSEGAAEIAAERRYEQGFEVLIAYSKDERLKDANELLQKQGEQAVRDWIETAIRWDGTDKKRSAPLPLVRELPPAATFPVHALGELVGGAASAIHAMTGAPLPMCATSVLGGVALVTQAHADVELPHGARVPLFSKPSSGWRVWRAENNGRSPRLEADCSM